MLSTVSSSVICKRALWVGFRQHPLTITDELHAMLVKRADDLAGCPAGSDEERELTAIERTIGAYEAVRWPTGKIAGGKG